jgi:hypothetical protein
MGSKTHPSFAIQEAYRSMTTLGGNLYDLRDFFCRAGIFLRVRESRLGATFMISLRN